MLSDFHHAFYRSFFRVRKLEHLFKVKLYQMSFITLKIITLIISETNFKKILYSRSRLLLNYQYSIKSAAYLNINKSLRITKWINYFSSFNKSAITLLDKPIRYSIIFINIFLIFILVYHTLRIQFKWDITISLSINKIWIFVFIVHAGRWSCS